MGRILSKFRKQPSTIERLENIDRDIESLLRLRRRDSELEKQYAGTLIIYSIVFYLVMALFFYFYFTPEDVYGRILQILPFLGFPVLIWFARKLMRWYFVKRVARCDMQLNDLRAEKKKILEEVKEKESYKKAKEILDKYDPASVSPPPPPRTPATPVGSPPVPILRQRPMSQGRGRGRGQSPMVPPNRKPGTPQTPLMSPQQMQQYRRPPSTIRPILQRERGTVDKLVDYLVGDGPSSRYALICRYCYAHNGMALQEEFEYLAFKCAYCGMLNPSRKVRPNAPKLPESAPSSSADQVTESSGTGSDSEEEPSQGRSLISSEAQGGLTSPGEVTNESAEGGQAEETLNTEHGEPVDEGELPGETDPVMETEKAIRGHTPPEQGGDSVAQEEHAEISHDAHEIGEVTEQRETAVVNS